MLEYNKNREWWFYHIYTGTINRMWESFKLKELTPDMFKCLIFIQDFTASKDTEIQSWILYKLEQVNQDLTLQSVAEKCQRMVNLKYNEGKFKKKDSSKIQICWLEKYNQKRVPHPNPCYGSGGLHFRKDCPFENKKKHYSCKRIG